MAKAKVAPELLELSRDLIVNNYKDAVYYDERANKLLNRALAIMAFEAVFLLFAAKGYLLYAGLSSLSLAFLAIAAYAIYSAPDDDVKAFLGKGLRFFKYSIDPQKNKRENFEQYCNRICGMSREDITYENLTHAFAMFYRYEAKVKAARAMNFFILLSVISFYFFVMLFFLAYV